MRSRIIILITACIGRYGKKESTASDVAANKLEMGSHLGGNGGRTLNYEFDQRHRSPASGGMEKKESAASDVTTKK